MHTPIRLLTLAVVPLLAMTACGDPDAADPVGSPGTPEPTVTSPSPDPETPSDDTTVPPGEFDAVEATRNAASLLGMPEADLPDDVRIARRGGEEFGLTMDLVPGRLTVELDEDVDGTYVVSAVSVETKDGSQLVTVDSLLENAASYLGTPEAGVDPSWRVGRRGDESFALTEDFVVGRITVELDDDGSGTYVVTAVAIELPGGARTVTEETRLADAAAQIGTAEADLADDARISRRGDELLPLTQDYRVGRFTFELDDDGAGTFRVVAVQVELPAGVQVVTDT